MLGDDGLDDGVDCDCKDNAATGPSAPWSRTRNFTLCKGRDTVTSTGSNMDTANQEVSNARAPIDVVRGGSGLQGSLGLGVGDEMPRVELLTGLDDC